MADDPDYPEPAWLPGQMVMVRKTGAIERVKTVMPLRVLGDHHRYIYVTDRSAHAEDDLTDPLQSAPEPE